MSFSLQNEKGVVYVPPVQGIDDNQMISSLCVENGNNITNETISVSCYDMPEEIFTYLSNANADGIEEFQTYLVNPMLRTVDKLLKKIRLIDVFIANV